MMQRKVLVRTVRVSKGALTSEQVRKDLAKDRALVRLPSLSASAHWHGLSFFGG